MSKQIKQTAFVAELTIHEYLHGHELIQLYSQLLVFDQRRGYRDKCFLVRFVLGTGLRVGEIATLRLADCHENWIYIRDGGNGQTKTGADRIVKIMPELRVHYKKYLREAQRREREYLLPEVCIRTLERWWQDMLEVCGIRRLSIHGGRHTYATHEFCSGRLNKGALKSQLGHSMASTNTERYYLHYAPDYIYADGEPEWREIATKINEEK